MHLTPWLFHQENMINQSGYTFYLYILVKTKKHDVVCLEETTRQRILIAPSYMYKAIQL